jgi:hypothetical protein
MEPTAGLDTLMQRKFFSLIREENARNVTAFPGAWVPALPAGTPLLRCSSVIPARNAGIQHDRQRLRRPGSR